jgi:poly(A) polymerase
VDAIVVGPVEVPREAFFESAREWLATVGGEAWIAEDAVAPVLRGAVSGVAVDLGYAALPPDLVDKVPEAMSTAELARLDPASRGALLAVRDASSVRAVVSARGAEGALRLSLRALKRWARARGLYSNAFGFLSGFGWTLLAAWGVTRDGEPAASVALGRVLDVLCACDPAYPVILTDDAAAYVPRPRDLLVLPSPAAPSRNVARNMTRGTAAVLRAEAARAGEIVARARRLGRGWEALFEPYDVRAEGGARVEIALRCTDRAGLGASLGWIEGHVLGLLLDLEAGPAPRYRPDPRRTALPDGVSYAIALEDGGAGAEEAAARFEKAFAAWEARPPGAALEVRVRAG